MDGRTKTLLLACRWRKTGESGLHWQGRFARDLGLTVEDFDFGLQVHFIRRYPSGYCRLLALGYRVLDIEDVDWPEDTSFPKTGLCDPPDMHTTRPWTDSRRCGCPEKMKLT